MAPWGAFVDAFAFNWAQPKPTTSILGTACLTLDGARCLFPYQLAPHSNHSGCFWRSSLEGFQCHVGENETGAPLFGECSSDCPRDCAAGYRKCNSSCIFQDAACGTDCPEGDNSFKNSSKWPFYHLTILTTSSSRKKIKIYDLRFSKFVAPLVRIIITFQNPSKAKLYKRSNSYFVIKSHWS